MPTVSLCMIVKNEEEVLDRCLWSVRGLVDEIIIVDTGSTDTTIDIAYRHGARVFHREWTDDFAEARNASFEQANCDYILWMDADDVILPEQMQKLVELKKRLDGDVYFLQYDYAQDRHGNSLCTLYRERIVRNTPAFRWCYPIHECISIPGGSTSHTVDITVTHRRTAGGAAADADRNLRILEKAIAEERYAGDHRVRYYLAKEYHDAGRHREAIEHYRIFLDSDGGWIEDRYCAQYRLAGCHLHLSRQEENEGEKIMYRGVARMEALRARRIDERRAEACYILGQISMDDEEYREAISWFELCLRPAPEVLSPIDTFCGTVGPLSQLCVCHDRLGELDKSWEYNERALRLDPTSEPLLHNRRYLTARRRASARRLEEPIKLNLGSGNKRYLDYVNCDKFPGTEVDWVIPLESIPLEDRTVTALHSEHALEHTYHTTARAALREWFRVLKPGGELLLKLPDLAACCRSYLEAPSQLERDWYRYTIYGVQRSQADEPMEGQIHYTGFSTEELGAELRAAGFVIDYLGTYDGYGTPSTVVRALRPASELRIGWVADGIPLEAPQYRIRTYHIDRWLRGRGYRSSIISSDQIDQVDVVIIARAYSWSELELIERARAAGKRVVVDVCEDLFELPFPAFAPIIAAADVVVCCSHVLAERTRAHNPNVMVIEDAVESDFARTCSYSSPGPLRVAWIGMGGNVRHAEALRPVIEELGYELVTIHEHDGADIRWSIDTWQDALASCDIAIAPIDPGLQPAKSNNRLTTYMALGLPTVAAPLDAYLRVVREGENGFIARNYDEWRQALAALADPELRHRVGEAGRRTARGYDLDTIAGAWRDLLVHGGPRRDMVDIVIPTCGDSPYLRACLDSIVACTPVPYRVIVVMSGVDSVPEDFPSSVVMLHSRTRLTYSEALNRGIAAGDGGYVCFMNDDVIVSAGWLEALRAELRDGVGICNPLSNCDHGWLHDYDLELDGVPLLAGGNTFHGDTIQVKGVDRPGFRPERLHGYAPSAERIYRREWVAFFCTLLTREAIERIGPLDEGFANGCEDLDYCRRAGHLGIECRVSERAFVFHFGGVSRTAREHELGERYRLEDHGNHERIALKYARPLLVIHTGDAYEPWSSASIDGGGIGGSETAAARMAEELAALGYRVVLFGRCEGLEGLHNGVEYVDGGRFREFIAVHHVDVFIASRYANLLEEPVRATARYLWVHDIFALGTSFGDDDLVRRMYGRLDGIFCLSPWHAEYFASVHGIPREKIIITGNGIDRERFSVPVERQPARFIYASSPDRGLDTLLELFPIIRARHPEAEVHVFYGFANWDQSIEQQGNAALREWRDRILRLMEQPGVFYHGRVGQRRLAEEFLRSDIWLHPTRFTETYCISALEAQMAGTICITSDLAALHTTVGDRGILIPGDAYDDEYRSTILREVESVLGDPVRRAELASRGRAWASRQTWAARAREWALLFATPGIDPGPEPAEGTDAGEAAASEAPSSDARKARQWSFLLAED